MATNTRNVDLRVSARTEGLGNLKQVGEALDRLEQQQGEFAKAAGTAGKSLNDLERELRDIDRAAGRLKNLNDLSDGFREQRKVVGDSARTIRRARQELADYSKTLPTVRKRTDEQRAAVKAYEKTITDAEKAQARARKNAESYANALRQAGVSGAEARRELARLTEVVARQQAQNRANVNDLPRRLEQQRAITEEAQRRAAIEQAAARRLAQVEQQRQSALTQRQARLEQALSVFRPELARREQREREEGERRITAELKRQRDAINQRIAAERKVVSGFAAFSRAAPGAPARARAGETNLASRQTAQRDADLAARQARTRALADEQQAQQRAAALEQRVQERLAGRPGLLGRVTQATRQTVAATKQAGQAQAGFADALRKVAGQGRTTLDFFQRLRGQVLELAATYGSLLTAVTVAQQAIAVSIERTGIENRLLFANNNDLQRTAEDLEFVRETADRLGQSYNNLAKLYSRFAAASAAAGEPIEKTRRIFGQLAEAFTVLGLSQADVEGSFRALEQSISKGSVQAEELRGQLGDRFPGATARFAKAIGVTVEELNKLLEAGRVSSSAIEFFAEDIALAARATLPRATNSLQSSLQRLSTAYQDFLATIVDSGFGDELARLARQLSAFFKSAEGESFARTISGAFSVVVTAARLLVENIEFVFFAFRLLIGYIAGRIFAAALAGAIASFSALARLLPVVSAALFGTGVAAGRAAIGIRTLTAALGPIALIVGLAATALVEFGLAAADAERQAEDFEKEMRALAEATGASRDELAQLNRQSLDSLRNEVKGLGNDLERARDRLADLKAEAEQNNRTRSADPFGALFGSIRIALAGRDVEKAQEALAKAEEEQRRREAADAQATDLAVQDALAARRGIFEEAARLQRQATDESNRDLLRTNDEFYNQYVRDAEAFATRLQSILSADELSPDELLTPAERATLEGALASARSARVDVRNAIRPGSASDDNGAKAEADRRLREIQQLEEAAQEERERSLRDSLERLTEDEATAAEARVELIKLEYAEKIAEQQKFQQQAAALGETGLAAQFTANIAALEGERENVIAIEQRETAVESLRTKYEALNETLDASVRKRDIELERINTERELGLITAQQAEQQAEAITREYQPQILANLQALRDFIEANAGALAKMFNVEEVLLQLDALQVKTETVVTAGERRAQELKESFAQGASQALSSLGVGIADAIRGFGSLGDAIKGARDAFLNFAADFLIQIGQMILQQAILNSLSGLSNSEGFLGAIGRAVAGVKHNGGMAGTGPFRSVPANLFANAPRYHSGGIVGLKSDEVPAILQTGEEVLARNDPRNAMNGGAKGGTNVQIVNAIDAESVVAAGLQGSAGRQIITNIIQANKSQFRQLLAS